MTFKESIETCFKKYKVFDGRAKRSEYWWFFVFCTLLGIVTALFDALVLGYTLEEVSPTNSIFQLIVLIPTFAVGARRLHDINKSGWWQLILLTVVGTIPLIYWFVSEGKNKKNRFGK